MKSAVRIQTLESALTAYTKFTTPAAYCLGRREKHTSTTSSRRRNIHSSPSHTNAVLTAQPGEAPAPSPLSKNASTTSTSATLSALSTLPLSQVLRTYLITAISSSPTLLSASSGVLRHMLESKNFLFSLDRNPLARAVLLETFYKQFCAGATPSEVAKVCQDLRKQGYAGVVLEYALEVLKDAEGNEAEDVAVWKQGMLSSVSMAQQGDFVAMKWSGMGSAALRLCAAQKEPTKAMQEAMHAVCSAAAAKDIALLPSAEETWNLEGYHKWTLDLQRVYNLRGKSVMYNTYQCYLKQTPAHLSQHLDIARKEGFTLGAKLVRGAYLASEPRHLIYPTAEDTHHAYDSVMRALIERKYNDVLLPTTSSTASNSSAREEQVWPSVNILVASHNLATVTLAQELRQQQLSAGTPLTPLVYSQLQGMASEVSYALIAAARKAEAAGDEKVLREKVFSFTNWGTMPQCLNYLLRRAAENKDAAGRTADTRKAMGAEIGRRMKAIAGMA